MTEAGAAWDGKKELAQRFDRRSVLAFVNQAMGRVTIPGVGTQEHGDKLDPSWPGSNGAAA